MMIVLKPESTEEVAREIMASIESDRRNLHPHHFKKRMKELFPLAVGAVKKTGSRGNAMGGRCV